MRTASVRRTVAAALIAGAFGAAGTAQAASQQDDFVSGSPQHDTTAVIAGGVEIAPAFIDAFDQLPTSSLTPWPVATEASRADAGSLLLNEALFNSGAAAGVGTSIKFRGILGAQDNQHVGFASGFENGRWAIFSRKEGSTVLSARMQNGGADQVVDLTADPNIAHDFRIDRTAQGFKFYVDGNQVATHTDPFTDPLFAQASDLSPGVPLRLESISVHDKSHGDLHLQGLRCRQRCGDGHQLLGDVRERDHLRDEHEQRQRRTGPRSARARSSRRVSSSTAPPSTQPAPACRRD